MATADNRTVVSTTRARSSSRSEVRLSGPEPKVNRRMAWPVVDLSCGTGVSLPPWLAGPVHLAVRPPKARGDAAHVRLLDRRRRRGTGRNSSEGVLEFPAVDGQRVVHQDVDGDDDDAPDRIGLDE